MQMTRKHMGILVAAASLSLLAACSKGDDNQPASSADSSASQPASPTPAPTPAPTPSPSSSQSSTTPGQADKSATGDKSGSSFSEDAKSAAGTVSDAAGKVVDGASNALSAAGDAIKSGAASADKAIQDTVGNGTSGTSSSKPATNEK